MPLYEYECQSCGRRFERIQKFSDAPIAECPTCAGPVKKLPSSPAIQFKGSGFYITDYPKSGKGSSSESGDKAEGKSKDKGDGASTSSASDKPGAPASSDASDKSSTPKAEPAKPPAGGDAKKSSA